MSITLVTITFTVSKVVAVVPMQHKNEKLDSFCHVVVHVHHSREMFQFSDSDSKDSDEGIRFKTDTTRHKKQPRKRSLSKSPDRHRSSHRPRRSHESYRSRTEDSRRRPTEKRSLSREKRRRSSSKSRRPKTETIENEKKPEETVIGPALPPHLLKTPEPSLIVVDEYVAPIGPALPPVLQKQVIGPTLPPHLREALAETPVEVIQEDEEEEEVFGPLPVGQSSRTQIALEERAIQLKIDQLSAPEEKEAMREEWMVELPEVKASRLGLGPRQFRPKAGPDMSDRSAWTDTPNEKKKEKSVDLKEEAELLEIKKRDAEQERMSKRHKKRNKESLLELHQSKMKQKKGESGPSERRPFSRDIDLQVNRFDEAQKKAVLKKAQLLDDRFSTGKSKFL